MQITVGKFANRSGARLPLVGTLLGGVLLCASGLNAQDRVFPNSDPMASGKIVEITRDSVRITVRRRDQTYDMSEVRKITFDGEPKGLDRARELMLKGQFDQAFGELKKLGTVDGESEPVKLDFRFYVAYCRGELGIASGNVAEQKTAGKQMLDLRRSNPQSHHYYELNDLVGRLVVEQGQNGRPFFEALKKGKSAKYQAVGGYRLGELELASGDAPKAKSEFESVIKLSANGEDVQRYKRLVQVGLAGCRMQAGETAAALKKLDSLVAKYDSTDLELFAKLNNARGACYVALGQPNQALPMYLQTDLLFFADPQTHAESLYHLSQLWAEVGEAGKAADTRARLQRKYASSSWAKKL